MCRVGGCEQGESDDTVGRWERLKALATLQDRVGRRLFYEW